MMIPKEEILKELMRRGVDPNQLMQQPQPEPVPQKSLGYGNWGAWPGAENIEQIPNRAWFLRNAPAVVGGATGGLGTMIGGPFLGVPMAGLGGAAGRAIQQEERQAAGEEIPYPKMFGEQAKSAAVEAGTEAIVPVAAWAGKKAIKPMVKKVIPKAPKFSAMLADYGDRIMKRFGSELTPEQAKYLMKGGRVHITAAGQTTDPFIDHVEEMMRGSLLGSDLEILRNYLQKYAQKVARVEFSENLWKEIGTKMSPFDVGYLFQESILDREKFAKKIISALYKNLDDVAKGAAKVDLRPAKRAALRELSKNRGRILKGPAGEINRLANQVLSMPDYADFSKSIFHRSDILYAQRALRARAGQLAPKNPQAVKFVNEIADFIDDSMEQTARQLDIDKAFRNVRDNRASLSLFAGGPEYKSFITRESELKEQVLKGFVSADEAAEQLNRYADELYLPRTAQQIPADNVSMERLFRIASDAKNKLHTDIISNDFIKGAMKVAEKKPEMVAPFIFKSFYTADAVHKIAPPKTWRALVAGKMEEILKASSEETSGQVTETLGEQIIKGRKFLELWDDLGEEVQKLMFPTRAQREAILEFGQMHRMVQDPLGATGGKMLIKLIQAGAIVGTALGKFTGTSGVILLGPRELSRLMASETGIQWLTLGLKTPATSPITDLITTNVLRIAREGLTADRTKTMKTKPQNWNPFKDFPGPPKILPEGGLFGTEEKRQKQNELILKSTR